MRTGDGPAGQRQGSALMRRGGATALVLTATVAIASILVLHGNDLGVMLVRGASAIADGVAGPGTPEQRRESLLDMAIIAVIGLVTLVVALTLIIGFLALRHRRVVHDLKQLAALEDTHGDEIDDAHRQASARETELRAVLDNMVDGVLTIDARGRVLSCNPAALGGRRQLP